MANPTNEHTSSKPHYYNSFPLILLSLILIHLSPVVNSATTTHSHKWDGIILTQSDYQSLLTFKHTIDPTGIFLSPTWNTTRQSSCTSWPGLRCQNGRVIAIHLPFKGLYGQITPKISYLTALRVLSLHDNFITGHIPHSITLLSNLRSLYLFNNRLSGPIPPSIFSLIPNLINLDLSGNSLNGSFNLPPKLNSNRLYRLNLSSNSFSGSIPQSLGNNHNLSTTLTILDLSKNNFSGEIPSSLSNLTHLTIFNVSHNTLSGNIPSPLSKKFNSSSFIGNRNLQLCGFTNSPPCPSSSPSPSPYSSPDILPPPSPSTSITHTRKLSTKDIILISAGAVLVILLLLCCILLCCLIRKRMVSRSRNKGPTTSSSSVSRGEKQTGQESSAIATTSNSTGKLVLFDGPFVFTAEDLLCATAEIMGKSAFGTVYKATLEDGNQVAVKRLREKLAKNPKEFENEVSNLGKIRHPHLLPLRAYYLGPKGEKLLVYDYLNKGSLSSFLHGGRSPETVIDWSVRMKIILGVARGLLHLHTQHNLIHGNLTSGDIYLDEQTSPRISDYGLSKLMTDTANANVISAASTTTTTTTGSITGYRAPELQKTRKPTTKTDIYSFGVIILELLTGKAPNEAVNGLELPQWVASVVKEEWSNEVFDLELMSGMKNDGDDEMVNTLKLALHMIDPSPDARPDAKQVVNQIEEISPQLGGDDEDDGNDDDDDDD